jgi:hypothetical protein
MGLALAAAVVLGKVGADRKSKAAPRMIALELVAVRIHLVIGKVANVRETKGAAGVVALEWAPIAHVVRLHCVPSEIEGGRKSKMSAPRATALVWTLIALRAPDVHRIVSRKVVKD